MDAEPIAGFRIAWMIIVGGDGSWRVVPKATTVRIPDDEPDFPDLPLLTPGQLACILGSEAVAIQGAGAVAEQNGKKLELPPGTVLIPPPGHGKLKPPDPRTTWNSGSEPPKIDW